MPNLLFVLFRDYNNRLDGISRKISYQADAFKSLGGEVYVSFLDRGEDGYFLRRKVDTETIEEFTATLPIMKKLAWRFAYNGLESFVTSRKIDVVYIRYAHNANISFINFLRFLKRSGIKVVLEVPTYPYDAEYKEVSFKAKAYHIVDKVFRSFMGRYIDKITTFSEHEDIFGVQTIKINNGVDLLSVQQRTVVREKVDAEINLIAVASMENWHGYDRLIEGLIEYYNEAVEENFNCTKVVLHLIGPEHSTEIVKYRKLVADGNREYVKFHGFLYGNKLDHLFNTADIAVGCLGVHRKGLESAKSLKNREYCARGIPFIYSEIDHTFDGKPYVLKMPADESPISIRAILRFLQNLHVSVEDIRVDAEVNLGWAAQMKPVNEFFLASDSVRKYTNK